jgi:hypothetical protein
MMKSPAITRTERPPEDWGTFAAAHGEFYHDPRWVASLADAFGFPLVCLTQREAGRVVGLLALAEVPGLFGGRRLVSLPFSYAAGPLAEPEGDVTLLLTDAIAAARERGIGRVEVKWADPLRAVAPPYIRTTRYHTYRVDTSGGEAAVLKRLHADSTRRGIRKAEKSGVAVRRAASEADWRVLADLQDRTSRSHGLPAPPHPFFTRTCASLQRAGLADLYLAEVPGSTGPVAGIVVWKGPRRWIYAFGASRPEGLQHRPNHALLWAALRDAMAAGVGFDLGRAAPEQEGLVEFKRRWGGEPVPLAYDYWPEAGGLNTADRSHGPLTWGAAVWRNLPLPLTRAGSFLYRYLG